MFLWACVNRMKDQLTNHMSTTNTQNKGQCDKGVHFDKYPNKEQCLVTEKENLTWCGTVKNYGYRMN